jgi:hypothetical protein
MKLHGPIVFSLKNYSFRILIVDAVDFFQHFIFRLVKKISIIYFIII